MDLLSNKNISPLLSSSVTSQTSEPTMQNNGSGKVIDLTEFNKEEVPSRSSIRIIGSKRLEVPSFLMNQISCCERLCNCCIFSCFFSKLHTIENIEGKNLETYYQQKATLYSDYNPNNPNHEDSLRFLFLHSLNSDLTNDLRSENWKKIGFISNDPRNEFGGGGYLALLFITHCAKQYEEDFKTLMYQSKVSFASLAITLCFYAKLALDYVDSNDDNNEVNENAEELRKRHKIKAVTVFQFRNYLNNISINDNYLYNVLATIIIQMKDGLLNNDELDISSNIISNNELNVSNIYDRTIKDHFNDIFYRELDKEADSLSSRSSSTE